MAQFFDITNLDIVRYIITLTTMISYIDSYKPMNTCA